MSIKHLVSGALLLALCCGLAAQPRSNAAAAPFGQGPGYHDPRSPFKPLEEKAGVLPWALLAHVTWQCQTKLGTCRRACSCMVFPPTALTLKP